MTKIKINLKKEIDNSYNIKFIENTWNELSDYLLSVNKNKILIVSDTNVFPLHYNNLISEIDRKISVKNIILEAGEEKKNIEAVLKICSKLIELKFNRNDLLVVLWWGVIWDITWMVASIFKRWIDFIQIPTTLLSMFDSSVWWKTGVDFEGVKNIIWAFKQPKLVLINSNYLETLPKQEKYSWYFEWLKHSLLENKEYYEEFKKDWDIFLSKELTNKNSPIIPFHKGDEQVNQIISKNVSVKARIVMEDEKEMWVRKFLNYWHTFWHSLESITNFELPHWICVWYWMIYVNILSNKLWFLNKKYLEEINNFIKTKILESWFNFKKINLDEKIENNFEKIYSKMISDKKNIDSNISFVLLEKPWKLFIEKIWEDKKFFLEESFYEFVKNVK